MKATPEIKNIYASIQKQLFYLVPEKWDRIYLYASVVEQMLNLETGELFFYYFPKGLLKKNPVNVYEIPSKFNLEEEEYIKLVENLYNTIKKLRNACKDQNDKVWSNITIRIVGLKFEVEYSYEDLTYSKYSGIERHVIWKYRNLDLPIESFNKKDRKIILEYLEEYEEDRDITETYMELIYKRPIKNVVEYNKEKVETSEEQPETDESEMEKLTRKNKDRLKEKQATYTYIKKEKIGLNLKNKYPKDEKEKTYIQHIEEQRKAVKSQILDHDV